MNNARLTKIMNANIEQTGEYVLYWMQRSQRVHFNHALSYAIEVANAKGLPVLVAFILTPIFLNANARHYTFMLEGLQEVEAELKRMKVGFVIKKGRFDEEITILASRAHTLVMDYGYLRNERQWRRDVLDAIIARKLAIDIALLESDVIVPVTISYPKVAYGAYVLRPQLHKRLFNFDDFDHLPMISHPWNKRLMSDIDIRNIDEVISLLNIDTSVQKSHYFKGGYNEAQKWLREFISSKFPVYPQRSDPSLAIQSYLSMYLHFGQISPLEIYQAIKLLPDTEAKEQFIEQLLVRRELAFNYVFYNKDYDQFKSMTEPWAYESMEKHRDDERPYLYSDQEIEESKTHDVYFNAAMDEMRLTGFMANYMRMYWAKQIVTWKKTYEEAYDLIVRLNNQYFLDGRDPNSYVNIAWIFGKMDRPWPEKPIWGILRSMNDAGLKRKFAMDDYVNQIAKLRKENAS
jgi:deoxyribodipyrimidine photo-lyase